MTIVGSSWSGAMDEEHLQTTSEATGIPGTLLIEDYAEFDGMDDETTEPVYKKQKNDGISRDSDPAYSDIAGAQCDSVNNVSGTSEGTLNDKDVPSLKKGMRFATLEDVRLHYNKYGGSKGFSTRMGGCKFIPGIECYKHYRYLCSKSGYRKAKKVVGRVESATAPVVRRKSKITRTGCQAKLLVALGEDNVWEVTTFNDDHNHPMCKRSQVHLLRSQKKVTDDQKMFATHFYQVAVQPCMMYRLLVVRNGGSPSAVGCTPRDLLNWRHKIRRLQAGHDANAFACYLEDKKKTNPSFVYTIDTDENNTFRGCFWSDAKSRVDHQFYGDCIVMDATYRTNKYNMIFATIVGVNNHRQTTVFGSALLSDEKYNTYKWLLETWLESMPNKTHPKIMVVRYFPGTFI